MFGLSSWFGCIVIALFVWVVSKLVLCFADDWLVAVCWFLGCNLIMVIWVLTGV